MKFEWDENKNKINFKKHNITFEEAIKVFESKHITGISNVTNLKETRQKTIGEIQKIIIIVVIHTGRNGKTRIISARKASKKERRIYYENVTS